MKEDDGLCLTCSRHAGHRGRTQLHHLYCWNACCYRRNCYHGNLTDRQTDRKKFHLSLSRQTEVSNEKPPQSVENQISVILLLNTAG